MSATSVKGASGNPAHRPVAAIFDLDGTITQSDTYLDFLTRYMRHHPHLALRLPALACAWSLYAARVRDNTWLKQAFLRLIAGGAARSEIEAWVKNFTRSVIESGLRPGAIRAIEHHRRAGHALIMATASFDFYVDALAAQLGFDRVVCTRAAWSERQTLTGQIAGANCYGQEKVRRLQEHFGDDRPGWLVHGYSDHHSDIPFLSWVDRPVAVNPTRKMRGIARRMGIEIVAWDA